MAGTTRMSKNETGAVVDENCKLLKIENCYVLGSSVFTTAGWVNPTLTIMALSISYHYELIVSIYKICIFAS